MNPPGSKTKVYCGFKVIKLNNLSNVPIKIIKALRLKFETIPLDKLTNEETPLKTFPIQFTLV